MPFLGVTSLNFNATYTPAFARLLAKEGYGFVVGVFGLDALEENYVLPTIMGKDYDVGRWVGCAAPPERRLGVGRGWRLTQARDIVFYMDAFTGRSDPSPQYWVVVGRLKQEVVSMLPAKEVTPQEVARILSSSQN